MWEVYQGRVLSYPQELSPFNGTEHEVHLKPKARLLCEKVGLCMSVSTIRQLTVTLSEVVVVAWRPLMCRSRSVSVNGFTLAGACGRDGPEPADSALATVGTPVMGDV